MEIINYNTNTGNLDLSTEMSGDPQLSFMNVLNKVYTLIKNYLENGILKVLIVIKQ